MVQVKSIKVYDIFRGRKVGKMILIIIPEKHVLNNQLLNSENT